MSEAVRIAAVGDIHIRESTTANIHELLTDISQKADILILAGDLTGRGTVHEAELLAAELTQCRIPVLGVLGNHDVEAGEEAGILEVLRHAGMGILDGEPCEIQGIGFAGVKGFCGGFDHHMLEPWGERIVKEFVREAVDETMRLETAMARLRTERKVVVLHYAPIVGTVVGEPEQIYPFLGSSRLIEPICRFGANLVVHGHAHRGSREGTAGNGIPVYNVSLPLMTQISPEQPYIIREV